MLGIIIETKGIEMLKLNATGAISSNSKIFSGHSSYSTKFSFHS